MSTVRIRAARITFFVLIVYAFGLEVFAQSTIVNAPSTDTLEEKFVYLEADYLMRLDDLSDGGFRSGGYRVVYGLKKDFEIGLNVFHTKSQLASQTELQPNAKWRFFKNEKHRLAASAGAIVFVPLNRQSGTRPTALVYTNISKGINFAGGARFTTGAYKVLGADSTFGAKSGATVALEKPIFKRVSLVGDWFSGKNRFGYTGAGVNFQLSDKQLLYTGYNFGNTGRANNFLSIFYGYTF